MSELADAGHPMPEKTGLAEDGRAPGVDLSFLDGAGEDYFTRLFVFMYGDRNWVVNNSTMQDYSRRAFIGGSVNGLSDLVADRLGTTGDKVGMDLAAGSRAQALRDLLDSGVLGRALATNYRDRMPRKASRDDLDHRDGNLTHHGTWREIVGWQELHAPEGFDLIMHRPVGGLQELKPATYQAAARILFDMVKPGGMMFSQVPRRVMNIDGGLRDLCRSVRSGGEVEDVVTTGERPGGRRPKDESDFYAVLLKSGQ
ncbi:MAG TPA: hypothetical protein VFX84_00265 [Candidatus Saccharimonadales bacterium]|nr:hypothetical protein [Candidatus Saccharimonadales bacterium]